MNYELTNDKLYILCGNSGTMLGDLAITPDCILSIDKLRESLLGRSPRVIDGAAVNVLEDLHQDDTYRILFAMLDVRMRQKMLTFIDAPNLTDRIRFELARVALGNCVDVEVIIFGKGEGLQPTSKLPYINVSSTDTFTVVPNLIDTAELDVVGDTHGLLSDLVALLSTENWLLQGSQFTHPDKNRKLLFLGDAVDRGPDSFKILEIIKTMCAQKRAYFVLGNHENKLLKLIEDYESGRELVRKSIAGAITFKKYLELPKQKQIEMHTFLRKCKTSYSMWVDKSTGSAVRNSTNVQKFGFAHADTNTFNDVSNLKSHVVYGVKHTKDPDREYQELYDLGINEHIYIRGHQPGHSMQPSVYSLDNRCAFAGDMMMLNFSRYLELLSTNSYKTDYEMFRKSTKIRKIKFDFKEHLKHSNIDADLKEIRKIK